MHGRRFGINDKEGIDPVHSHLDTIKGGPISSIASSRLSLVVVDLVVSVVVVTTVVLATTVVVLVVVVWAISVIVLVFSIRLARE